MLSTYSLQYKKLFLSYAQNLERSGGEGGNFSLDFFLAVARKSLGTDSRFRLLWKHRSVLRIPHVACSGTLLFSLLTLPACGRQVRCGDDIRKFEPTCPEHSRRKTWLKFKDIDKSIRELRAMFKVHPEWFEIPKPKSIEGKNEVNYSIQFDK